MTTPNTEREPPEAWVLGAGGTRGLALLGYLATRKSQLSEVKRWIGISVGAIVALGMTLGYDPDLLYELLDRTLSRVMPWRLQLESYVSVLDDRVLQDMCDRLIRHRGYASDMSYTAFSEQQAQHAAPSLETWTYCTTCQETLWIRPSGIWNLSHHRPDDVHSLTPWTVWGVVRASIGFPIWLSPVCIDGHCFVDGMTNVYSHLLMYDQLQQLVTEGCRPTYLPLYPAAAGSGESDPEPSHWSSLLQSQFMDSNDPEWSRWIGRIQGNGPWVIRPIWCSRSIPTMDTSEWSSHQSQVLYACGQRVGREQDKKENEKIPDSHLR